MVSDIIRHMDAFMVQTKSKYELVDITSQVNACIQKTKIQSGIALVFIPHTTAGIICNENESNLKSDILKVIKKLEDKSKLFGGFTHDRDEGNAHAHIAAAINGSSRNFIIEGGKLKLGTWQSIMLLEMDGPRKRQIWMQIVASEK